MTKKYTLGRHTGSVALLAQRLRKSESTIRLYIKQRSLLYSKDTGLLTHVTPLDIPNIALKYNINKKEARKLIREGGKIGKNRIVKEQNLKKEIGNKQYVTYTFKDSSSGKTRVKTLEVVDDGTAGDDLQGPFAEWIGVEALAYIAITDVTSSETGVGNGNGNGGLHVLKSNNMQIFNRNYKNFDTIENFAEVFKKKMKWKKKSLSQEIRNCYMQWTLLNYGKNISLKTLNKYLKDYTAEEIHNMAVKEDFTLRIFGSDKKLIKYHQATKRGRPCQNFVVQYEHIYPIPDMALFKKQEVPKFDFDNTIARADLKPIAIKALKQGIVPNIWTNGHDIKYMNIKDKFFTVNEAYQYIYDAYKEKGILTEYSPLKSERQCFEDIFKLYCKENINSHAPYFSCKVHNYKNPDWDGDISNDAIKKNDMIGVDMNKCYPSLLRDLEYLLVHDSYADKYYKYEDQKIEDHFIYNVEMIEPQFLLMNSGTYTGEHLKYCEHKYVIREVFECRKVKNYYTEFVSEILENDWLEPSCREYDVKSLTKFKKYGFVTMIGNMENNESIDGGRVKFKKFANKNEMNAEGLEYEKLYENNYMLFERSGYHTKFIDKKPIALQIKSRLRLELAKTMNKLGLKMEDILQIKTDNILFRRTEDNRKKVNGWLLYNMTKKWKYEIPKIGKFDLQINEKYEDIIPTIEWNTIKDKNSRADTENVLKKVDINKNIMFDGYAGVGKSYIIDKVYNKYKDEKNIVILTPTHSALVEYRKKGYKSDILCSFSKLKKYKNHLIIIDEFGMCGRGHWLKVFDSKLVKNCVIHAYGDYRQLPPIGYKSIEQNPYMLNKIFDEFVHIEGNWRNDIPLSFYKKIINGMSRNEIDRLLTRINKYNKKSNFVVGAFYDCEGIGQNINNIISKKLKKDMFIEGCKIVCKSNDMRIYEIYNNYEFTFVSDDEEYVTLSDGEREYKIAKKYYVKKNFRLGYYTTVYSVQGKTISWGKMKCIPDEKLFYDSRMLYTLVSRYSGDIYKYIK